MATGGVRRRQAATGGDRRQPAALLAAARAFVNTGGATASASAGIGTGRHGGQGFAG